MSWNNLSTTEVIIGGEACILKLQRTADADAMVPLFDNSQDEWTHRIVLQPKADADVNLFAIELKTICMDGAKIAKDGYFAAYTTASAMYTMFVLNLNEPLSTIETATDLVLVPAMELYPMRCEEIDQNDTIMRRVFTP